jgi:hypothetical protein
LEHTGQWVQRMDTGSQVSNLAWARDTPEQVRFLHVKIVLSLVTEMVFLSEIRLLLYIWKRGGKVFEGNVVTFENTFPS